MKRYILSLVLTLFSVAVVLSVAAVSTNAYDFVASTGLDTTAGSSGHLDQRFFGRNGSIEGGISVIISAVLSVLGILFLALMIWSGLLWMTARGDAKKVEKAKDILIDSIIGIIVVSGAYAITYFVLGGVEGSTLSGQIFSR